MDVTAKTGLFTSVALRKESVDRNYRGMNITFCIIVSLSARRAWIEMQGGWLSHGQFPVALRKESVDRNIIYLLTASVFRVALRKESVDRNNPLLW